MRTKLYNSWRAMKERCYNENYHAYNHYGGRGISVCEKWQHFKGFEEDMSETWSLGLELDRKDNDGNYCKENCEWATRSTQCMRQRRNPQYLWEGKKYYLKELSEKYNIPHKRLGDRVRKLKWTLEKALTEPKLNNQYATR